MVNPEEKAAIAGPGGDQGVGLKRRNRLSIGGEATPWVAYGHPACL